MSTSVFAEIILKCDRETWTKLLQDAVIQAYVGVEVMSQEPPERHYMANGGVEMAVREVKKTMQNSPNFS